MSVSEILRAFTSVSVGGVQATPSRCRTSGSSSTRSASARGSERAHQTLPASAALFTELTAQKRSETLRNAQKRSESLKPCDRRRHVLVYGDGPEVEPLRESVTMLQVGGERERHQYMDMEAAPPSAPSPRHLFGCSLRWRHQRDGRSPADCTLSTPSL